MTNPLDFDQILNNSIVGVTLDDSGALNFTVQTADSPTAPAVILNGTDAAPVISTGDFSGTYSTAAHLVDPVTTITDVDSPTMTGATVTVENVQSGDLVSLPGGQMHFADNATIVGSYVNGTLTLTGQASQADYVSALQSVTFASPTQFVRTFDISVQDGHNVSSNIAHTTLTDPPLPVTLEDASNHVVGTFATIQAAVDAATNGDSVLVAAGTYQEQVTVDGKDITIEGAGQGQTIIKSPDFGNLVSNIQNPGEDHTFTDALVGVENGGNITVKNLTIDGNNQGVIYAVGSNGGGDLVGVEAVNSSVTVDNVHITGIEDVESGILQGGQGNKAIIVNDTNSTVQTATVTNSTIDNFQKDGILLEGTGLTVHVNNNAITGVGAAPTNIAQNLIELDSGATGSITHNNVTGVSDADFGSIGILMFNAGSGVTVNHNTVSGLAGNVNSLGIFFAGTDAPTAEFNTISDQGFALIEDGGSPFFLGFSDPFNTALVQTNNVYTGDGLNYFFYAGPASTNQWLVTGTGGPDDLEGGANNDIFTVTGGAPNGNIFVGNAGIDTVQGYDGGAHLAVQTNQWVVTNGTATDTLTGIEKVIIGGQTYDLVDNFGQDVGGFQSVQAAVNAAHNSSDTIVEDIAGNLVFIPSPTIAINPVNGNNLIDKAEAPSGVVISGTESGADGQTVTVKIVSDGTLEDSYTATAANGVWSVSVTPAQVQALADGTYQVTANVSDSIGLAATPATQPILVETVSVGDLTPLQQGIDFFTDTVGATTEAALINAGTQTIAEYVNQLIVNNQALSQVMMAVDSLMFGAVDTQAEMTSLTTGFIPGQLAFFNSLPPAIQAAAGGATVWDAEVTGFALSGPNGNGGPNSTNFAHNFASLNTGANAGAAGNMAFAEAVSTAVFGNLSETNQALTFLTSFISFFTANPSALNGASLLQAADGITFGVEVGIALSNPTTVGAFLFGQVSNALIDNAEGILQVGVPLGLQGHANNLALTALTANTAAASVAASGHDGVHIVGTTNLASLDPHHAVFSA